MRESPSAASPQISEVCQPGCPAPFDLRGFSLTRPSATLSRRARVFWDLPEGGETFFHLHPTCTKRTSELTPKAPSLFPDDSPPDLHAFEVEAARHGYRCVAGVDEAGRGPLAGPVVAAAVILPDGLILPGVDDSKKLSPALRDELFDLISAEALAVGVGIGDHELVDRINILQATLSAMRDAILRLNPAPDYLLIDGISAIPMNIPQRTIKKGDSLSYSIAAASIIAKVTRDRLMVQYDSLYPGYGFAAHKGYGAASHLAAIASLGPSPIHRKSFRGVKEHLLSESEAGRLPGACDSLLPGF